MDRLSSERGVLSVELKTARRQLGTAKTETGTVSGHLTEQRRLKEDAQQKMTDLQYEQNGASVKTTQFGRKEGRMQKGFAGFLRQIGRLKAGVDRIRDKWVKTLHLDLRKYIRAGFAASKTSTTTHRGLLSRLFHIAITITTDGLEALIKTIEGLQSTSFNDN